MVRIAVPKDKAEINALRKEVNELHVQGRPDMFKPGFSKELQDHVDAYLNGENGYAAVAERDGEVVGMVMVDYFIRPENAYAWERKLCHIKEICVRAECRGRGVGKALLDFVRRDARQKGFPRIELDVWDFNDALGFYEAEGYTVFRRYLELNVI